MNPLRCNIYKDALQRAELFGKPVLYTGLPIERESIPENWYCYDLTGSDRNPTKPVTLEDRAVWNRVGSVLSPVPLKRETTRARQFKDSFSLHEELLDLAGFCEENHLDCPCDPRKYVLRPASPGQEAGLFYSLGEPEEDAAAGTVGHLRLYFSGGRLHHTWWPHNGSTRRRSRRRSRSLWTSCGHGGRCKARPPCAGGAIGIQRARLGETASDLWRKLRTTGSACGAAPAAAITAISTATT